MSNWIENLKWDSLNSDPMVIKWFKNIRTKFRTNKRSVIIPLIVLLIISLVFISCVEPLIGNNIWFKVFLMVLNLITFVGVFYPLTIQKTISKDDAKNIFHHLAEEKELNDKCESNSQLG